MIVRAPHVYSEILGAHRWLLIHATSRTAGASRPGGTGAAPWQMRAGGVWALRQAGGVIESAQEHVGEPLLASSRRKANRTIADGDYAHAKLDRAREHLAELQTAVDAFRDQDFSGR